MSGINPIQRVWPVAIMSIISDVADSTAPYIYTKRLPVVPPELAVGVSSPPSPESLLQFQGMFENAVVSVSGPLSGLSRPSSAPRGRISIVEKTQAVHARV